MTAPVALPLRFRPFGARMAAAIAGVTLVATVATLWTLMSAEVQDSFSTSQRVTLLLIFGVMLALLNGVFRTSALAEEQGLTIVNGYKVRRFDWPELVRLTLTPNRPWALIDLSDGETVSVMAIQSSDGQRATRTAQVLAALIAAQTLTDRND